MLVGVPVGALIYLAAYGARMPILALRGLLRTRNLALIVVPAVVLGLFALALQDRVDGRIAGGAISVAIVPAPLVATGIVARLRGRMDLAGALGLGTILVSLLIIGSRGSLASAALFAAFEAFAIAAMVAGALPPLRDALLPVLRVAGWLAFVLVIGAAALWQMSLVRDALGPGGVPLLATPAFIVQSVAIAAALFLVGAGAAYAVARTTGRDPLAAIAGAGLRDPALAVALAAVTAGPDSTGVPLVYAVFCLVLTGFALLRR